MWNPEKSTGRYSRLDGSHSPSQSLSTSQSATSSQASTVVRVKKTAPSAAPSSTAAAPASSSHAVKERASSSSTSRSQHRTHNSRASKSRHSHKAQKDKDKILSAASTKHRPCKEHVFLTDVADVRQMETGLLQMLDDFHSGRLQAFGKECSFEDMDNVRDLQEKLSRVHFDLDTQQQAHALGSDESREAAAEHMEQLLVNLEQLSSAIQRLHPSESNTSSTIVR
ncbi:coiled-coil domain-containing protein 28B-like [Ptychodera flava]|uniref:coiled-coil domain-containing protein 28B-like n=1 Tax=Ptychodera flava TaxID=63121 RepID=UPI00396A8E74